MACQEPMELAVRFDESLCNFGVIVHGKLHKIREFARIFEFEHSGKTILLSIN